jgi:hypothetical protein
MKTTSILIAILISLPLLAAEYPQGIIYLHPKPGAQYIPPQSSIILRTESLELIDNEFSFYVQGSHSGALSGDIIISDSTLIYKPHQPFSKGETVGVSISADLPGWTSAFDYQFTIHSAEVFNHDLPHSIMDHADNTNETKTENTYGRMTVINGVSVPADFPHFEPDIITEGIAPGRIFLNNRSGNTFIMILDNDGSPYFYKRLEERTGDFKLQPNGLLTRRHSDDLHAFVGMDSNFTVIDTFRCANGYGTDSHELTMLDDGHYFLIAVGYREINMSGIVPNGKQTATLVDNHIQEFDADGNLVFEWLSHEHFDIRDAVHEDLTGHVIEYVHMNSIAIDYDGHIIVSSRHLSEITKIHRHTGDIIWRLGGVNNQFDFVNDVHGLSYQHDARPVAGKPGLYTIFDNGNYRTPRFSRAVEFALDTEHMTATKVWEYRHSPDRYTSWMGNAQRLDNGNTLINWGDGSLPKATEVTPDGEVVYEADFVRLSPCYRTFRFEWESVVDRPYLLAESYPDRVTLIFNKFGDENVSGYVVYGGTNGNSLAPMDTTSNPFIHLTNLTDESWYTFRVKAIDNMSNESASSNTVDVFVNYAAPGENLLRNGDFSQGSEQWQLFTSELSAASADITGNGEYHLRVNQGGDQFKDVQIVQEPLSLIRERKYVFEFDAYAEFDRIIEARAERSTEPYTDYGMIGPTILTRKAKRYTYEFTLNHPNDYSARVVFRCGRSTADVFLDNISLREVVSSGVAERDTETPPGFTLSQNYPNPFNPLTSIQYHLPVDGDVDIAVFNLAGRRVRGLVTGGQSKGTHTVQWNGRDDAGNPVSSGVYLYRLKAGRYSETKKLLLLK